MYYAELYAFEFEKHYLPHIKVLTEVCPYFSFVYDICKNTVEAKRNFNESSDTSKIAEVMEVYNTLTPSQIKWFEAVDGTAAFAEKAVSKVTDLGTEYTYNRYKTAELIEFCVSMEFYQTIIDFDAAVNAVELPYTNSDIAAVKAAYAAVSESIIETVNADVLAKYKEILAAIGPDEASDAQPDLSAYTETEVSFKDISEKDAEMLADATIEVILNAVGAFDFEALINENVISNSMVATLSGVIYPFLLEETDGWIKTVPSDMEAYLGEEKYAKAVELLNAAGDDWAAVSAVNGDFGFEDGDVDGFLDAMAAMLRGASLINVVLTLENTADTEAGVYTYGAYEELIEVFELLDLDYVMSSAEYTEYANAAENKDDAKFRAILAPVANLFVELGNDLVNTICDVLPKLTYVIDSGIADKKINSLLSMFKVVTVGPVDLTTAGVYKMISDAVLVPNNIALSEAEFAALIKDLAGCGTAVSKPSVQRGQNYRMGIESDRAKTIVVLMTWILDVAESNSELVNTLLDTFSDNVLLKDAIRLIFNASLKFIPRKIIFMLASIFITMANLFGGFFK